MDYEELWDMLIDECEDMNDINYVVDEFLASIEEDNEN